MSREVEPSPAHISEHLAAEAFNVVLGPLVLFYSGAHVTARLLLVTLQFFG